MRCPYTKNTPAAADARHPGIRSSQSSPCTHSIPDSTVEKHPRHASVRGSESELEGHVAKPATPARRSKVHESTIRRADSRGPGNPQCLRTGYHPRHAVGRPPPVLLGDHGGLRRQHPIAPRPTDGLRLAVSGWRLVAPADPPPPTSRIQPSSIVADVVRALVHRQGLEGQIPDDVVVAAEHSGSGVHFRILSPCGHVPPPHQQGVWPPPRRIRRRARHTCERPVFHGRLPASLGAVASDNGHIARQLALHGRVAGLVNEELCLLDRLPSLSAWQLDDAEVHHLATERFAAKRGEVREWSDRDVKVAADLWHLPVRILNTDTIAGQ
mmetsp:Transcript_62531/g.179841  ORF Transcript_62531/g.179841 Transcript_62531/m.179841 type:complete len:326 (-) Transcript_62531:689-1666(-)